MSASWPALLALLLAAGCASRAPVPEPVAEAAPTARAPAPADPQVQQFELLQRERALQAERQGHWADAALAWETLAALRPESPEIRRQRADVQREIDAALARRLPLAAAARQRGDLDTAARLYIEVLAMAQSHTAAADALREVERERNKRQVVGRFSRQLISRGGHPEATPITRSMAPKPAAPAAPAVPRTGVVTPAAAKTMATTTVKPEPRAGAGEVAPVAATLPPAKPR